MFVGDLYISFTGLMPKGVKSCQAKAPRGRGKSAVVTQPPDSSPLGGSEFLLQGDLLVRKSLRKMPVPVDSMDNEQMVNGVSDTQGDDLAHPPGGEERIEDPILGLLRPTPPLRSQLCSPSCLSSLPRRIAARPTM